MDHADRQIVRLADGSRVTIRPIAANDGPMLQAFIRGLSARSRRLRFFSALVELPAAELERLVNLDHRAGLALVAVNAQSNETQIIAEARCVLDYEDHGAEFAIAVADAFQRRGLGKRLMKKLVAYAIEKGLRRLFGEILIGNHAMRALAVRLGFQIRPNALDHCTMIASIVPSARLVAEPWPLAGGFW